MQGRLEVVFGEDRALFHRTIAWLQLLMRHDSLDIYMSVKTLEGGEATFQISGNVRA